MYRFICALLLLFPYAFCNGQVPEAVSDYLSNEIVYRIPLKSGIFDVYRDCEKIFSFRQVVNIEYLIFKEKLLKRQDIYVQTENDFIGIEASNDAMQIRSTGNDERTDATWIFYVELYSPKYHLGNGIYVGMSVNEFEKQMNIEFSQDHIIFMLSGV